MNKKIAIIILALVLAVGGYFGVMEIKKAESPTEPVPKQLAGFTGTVKKGSQLNRNYCPNALYLVAEEGAYLANQTTQLQLRVSSQQMLTDESYLNKKVNVQGVYPDPKQVFCEALTCNCEDYILMQGIEVIAGVK